MYFFFKCFQNFKGQRQAHQLVVYIPLKFLWRYNLDVTKPEFLEGLHLLPRPIVILLQYPDMGICLGEHQGRGRIIFNKWGGWKFDFKSHVLTLFYNFPHKSYFQQISEETPIKKHTFYLASGKQKKLFSYKFTPLMCIISKIFL